MPMIEAAAGQSTGNAAIDQGIKAYKGALAGDPPTRGLKQWRNVVRDMRLATYWRRFWRVPTISGPVVALGVTPSIGRNR